MRSPRRACGAGRIEYLVFAEQSPMLDECVVRLYSLHAQKRQLGREKLRGADVSQQGAWFPVAKRVVRRRGSEARLRSKRRERAPKSLAGGN